MSKFLDIHPDLCHNCGTCIAICPETALSRGKTRPRLTGSCKECGLCYDCCPGIAVDFHKLNQLLFPGKISDIYFGCYDEMLLGRALKTSSKSSSSGGVVTALLTAAMEKGLIEAAGVVSMDPAIPYMPKVKIARTIEEIQNASGSKYSLIPTNSILKETVSIKGPIAWVGLPCHIHGLRKLQAKTNPLAAKISYTIGLFCGYNLLPEAIFFILKKLGVSPADVNKIYYRAGEWPGSFLVENKNGTKKTVPKLAFNFLHWLYLPKRCTLCPDLFAEMADISVGDYWPTGKSKTALSSIIARNEDGRKLLENARALRAVELTPLAVPDLYRSHAHLIKYKKRSVFLRIRFSFHKPSFNIKKPYLFWGEYISTPLSCIFLWFGRKKVLHSLIQNFPLRVLGNAARLLRKFSVKHSMRWSKQYWTLSAIGGHWDQTDEYDAFNIKTYSYTRRFTDGYRIAAPHITENAKVLDISCRTGKGALYFGTRKNICLTGMAPSKTQILKARNLLEKTDIPFTLLEWNKMRLPFPDKSFDIVLSFETAEHIFQYKDFFRRVASYFER